jgi:hypothetical protein
MPQDRLVFFFGSLISQAGELWMFLELLAAIAKHGSRSTILQTDHNLAATGPTIEVSLLLGSGSLLSNIAARKTNAMNTRRNANAIGARNEHHPNPISSSHTKTKVQEIVLIKATKNNNEGPPNRSIQVV